MQNKTTKEGIKYLSGWKDIAGYLGRGVRTVQRYEREMDLPVRRLTGKTRASVVITKAELDAWMAATHGRDRFQVSRSFVDYDTQTASMSRGVREMARLKAQMRELTEELKKSVALLHQTITSVQDEVYGSWRKRGAGVTLPLDPPWTLEDRKPN